MLAAGGTTANSYLNQRGISLVRLNADDTQDTTCGSPDGLLLGYTSGTQTYDVGASDIAVLADGSLALALSGNDLMARVLPNGRPDTTFGNGGVISSPFYIQGTRIATLPDGGFIIAGTKFRTANGEPNKIVVLKLDQAGQLDQRFGDQGVVILDNADRYAQLGALVVDSIGNVTVAGKVGGIYDPNGMLFPSDKVLVARLNAAGQPDSTFGDGGSKLLGLPGDGENINRMLLLPDRQLLLGGLVANGANYLTDYLLIKLTSNGQLDTSFGQNGVAEADSGDQYDEVSGMAVQADGKIMATGPAGLARFTAAGQLDTSFGADGFVKRGGEDLATGQDVAVTPVGKIIVFTYENIRRLIP